MERIASIEMPFEQGSDEWKAARAGMATASRFSDVMATTAKGSEAADRRNYRTDLVVERLTGTALDGFQSAAMRQGIEREPLARVAFEAETGLTVRRVGLFRHPTLLAGASPDGLIHAASGLEIKCPERSAHLRYLQQDGVPPEYQWQVIGQMWICNLETVHFVSWNPDFPEHLQLIVRRIQRNEEAIKKLATEVEKFLKEVDAETEKVRNLKVAA